MLTFKYQADLDKWRQGKGPRLTRDWITLANAIAEHNIDESITVTSWYAGRKDDDPSGHVEGACFDVRFKNWDDGQVTIFIGHCVKAGIPVVDLGEGANRHGHVGDVMTKVTEGR